MKKIAQCLTGCKKIRQKSVTKNPTEEQVFSRKIDDYHQKFTLAPIGYWSHAVGSFSGVCDELWEFRPNKTGRVVTSSAFGGQQCEMLFEWKEVAALTIACRVTEWFEAESEENLDLDEEEWEWETIRYDFKPVPTDVGVLIGMYQIHGYETENQGFWYSLEPLLFQG
jgi:hypothetical protein